MGNRLRAFAFLFLGFSCNSSAMEKQEQEIILGLDEYYEWYTRFISVLNTLPFELTQYHKEYDGIPISGNFGPVLVENYRKFNFEFLVATVPARVLEDPKLLSLRRFFNESMSVRLTDPPYRISERIDTNFVCRFQIESSCDMYLTRRIREDFKVEKLPKMDALKLVNLFY